MRQLKKSLEGEGVQEKRAKLLFYQHSVEQQPLKPGRILYERLPSVSYSIGTWVEYQLKCLQPEFNNDMIQTMEKQEADKVHLSVSVAMLGLFVRLLREEEIIVNNNQAELIRFFAAHFTTTRQSIISAVIVYLGCALGCFNTYLFTKEGSFTESQYGLVSTFTAIANIMLSFANLGMQSYIYKFYPYYKDNLPANKNDLLTWALMCCAVGFTIIIITGIFIRDLVVQKYVTNAPELV